MENWIFFKRVFTVFVRTVNLLSRRKQFLFISLYKLYNMYQNNIQIHIKNDSSIHLCVRVDNIVFLMFLSFSFLNSATSVLLLLLSLSLVCITCMYSTFLSWLIHKAKAYVKGGLNSRQHLCVPWTCRLWVLLYNLLWIT